MTITTSGRLILAALAMLVAAACVAYSPSVASAQSAGGDVDCPQVSKAEAERLLQEDPSDPNGLDGDSDGDPCESNAGTGTAGTAGAAQYEDASQGTGALQYGAAMPDTAGASPAMLALALAGLLTVALGAGGYGTYAVLVRRRA